MRAMERFKTWYRRTTGAENAHSDGSVHCADTAVSCSCLPRSKSSGHYDVRNGADPNAGAMADIKAQNRTNQHQKACIPKKYMSRSSTDTSDFFAEYGEANRYVIKEIIGKGSYGIVCSALDTVTGCKVAIKKITNVFDHVSDATRILREIKLLRMLKHNDIVEIKHIMLPPNHRDFKDIYVVFELMETDLHQVIKANDDLTPEHHQFFLYQMLRGLKYIHSARVYHRDLKPKNILANSDCKLKICDFGLARPSLHDMPSTIYWTDYVATRWYRAPELCGSFFAKYSPAIDIWSVGCIFAEVLLGKPLFPGRNVVHQLELITDQLGTPPPEVIAKVKNDKARRFLNQMRHKNGVLFEQTFPKADRGALRLLKKMLEFDPSARPTAEEALADPYFSGLASPAREPTSSPISKLAFDFERRKLAVDEVRELIYREILEYHPAAMNEYLASKAPPPRQIFPSPLDTFKWQFGHLEGPANLPMGSTRPMHPGGSIQRERVQEYQNEAAKFTARHSLDAAKAVQERAHERAKSIDNLGYAVRGMTVSERMHPTYTSASSTTTSAHHSIRSNNMQPR